MRALLIFILLLLAVSGWSQTPPPLVRSAVTTNLATFTSPSAGQIVKIHGVTGGIITYTNDVDSGGGGNTPFTTNTFTSLTMITPAMTVAMQSNLVKLAPQGSAIQFAPGHYPIARLGASRAIFDLSQKTNITLMAYGAVFSNNSTIPGPLFHWASNRNVRIFGLTSYGGGVVATNTGVYGEITTGLDGTIHIFDSEVADCTFYDAGNHGIIAVGTNVFVHHNKFIRGGDTNHSLTIDGAAVALSGFHRVEDNYIESFARGIELQSNVDIRQGGSVRRNVIIGGTGDWDIGVIGAASGPQDTVYIEDNIIERNPLVVATNLFALDAITVTASSNVVVRGNQITKATVAFSNPINGLVIENNTWRAPRTSALTLSDGTANFIVRNNYFYDCPTRAIFVFGNNHTIDGNYIQNCSENAIWLLKGAGTTTNVNITRNRIVDTRATPLTAAGVTIGAGCERIYVAGNEFDRLVANIVDAGTATIQGSYILVDNASSIVTLSEDISLVFSNRLGIASPADAVLRLLNDDFSDLARMTFSLDDNNAALKSATTALHVRTGDDTDFRDFAARSVFLSGALWTSNGLNAVGTNNGAIRLGGTNTGFFELVAPTTGQSNSLIQHLTSVAVGDTWQVFSVTTQAGTNSIVVTNISMSPFTNSYDAAVVRVPANALAKEVQVLVATNDFLLLWTNQVSGKLLSLSIYNNTATNITMTHHGGVRFMGGASNVVAAGRELAIAAKFIGTNISLAFAPQTN